jgi:hypothetical protein
MKNSTIGSVGALALMLVASLAFTLPALGAPRPDDRSGLRGVGAASDPVQVRPDDRSGLRGIGVIDSAALRPDDRGGFRGTDVLSVAPTVASLHPDNGFDWGAAGAGAGSATALMLLLLGAALVLRRNYNRPGAPA